VHRDSNKSTQTQHNKHTYTLAGRENEINMPHILYSPPMSYGGAKALIAAKYGNVDVELDKDFKFGVTNKTEEFLKLNPFGKIPTLKTTDGKGIFESNAIARYVARVGNARDQLLGATPYEQAVIDEWIDVVSYNIQPHIYHVYGFKFGYLPYNEQQFHNARNSIAQTLTILEKELSHDYLTGNKVTLADIILGCVLSNPFKISLDAEFRKPFPKLEAYFRRLYSLPHFEECLGKVEFAEKFDVIKSLLNF